jgi:hypothetical protein
VHCVSQLQLATRAAQWKQTAALRAATWVGLHAPESLPPALPQCHIFEKIIQKIPSFFFKLTEISRITHFYLNINISLRAKKGY